MTQPSINSPSSGVPSTHEGRLAVLDLARGVAIVAMAIYHFSWDLSWFAFVDWDVGGAPGWRAFAVSIAASFLILVGVSLDLAHHKEIRWRSFWKRFALITVSAACVSIGTYFAFGDSFVRFGILHCIAVSSLIALPFTRLPLLYALVASAIILALPHWASSSVFDGDMWLWTGLGTPAMPSVDYVPLAPWTGATLLGVALSKAIRQSALMTPLKQMEFGGLAGRALKWMGRHSLPIYLLHQPLLYGLVWSVTLLGPNMDRTSRSFQTNCAQSCTTSIGNEALCVAACRCTLDGLKSENIWEPLLSSPQDPDLQTRMNQLYSACLAAPGTDTID
ncbi:heparan-alpha-glucosaminide N-acetyltransferase [Roseibium sp.]|uniref:heparan-alpha-glucosaminide N-acetyltransferase n=1 Tax=Roseibium sp. TaxID=1936156 RepID=UPI003D0BCBC5